MAARGARATLSCGGCGGVFSRLLCNIKPGMASYCSRSCISTSKAVARSCKHCGASFTTQRGRLSGRTNSAANYCGRECYWASMRKPKAELKGRGGTCQRICAEAIAATPYCACCGTRKSRLEAHHIIPRRRGGKDEAQNLIPLCPTCHKLVERNTRAMEAAGMSTELVGFYMTARLRFLQARTAHILRKIAHETRQQVAA